MSTVTRPKTRTGEYIVPIFGSKARWKFRYVYTPAFRGSPYYCPVERAESPESATLDAVASYYIDEHGREHDMDDALRALPISRCEIYAAIIEREAAE